VIFLELILTGWPVIERPDSATVCPMLRVIIVASVGRITGGLLAGRGVILVIVILWALLRRSANYILDNVLASKGLVAGSVISVRKGSGETQGKNVFLAIVIQWESIQSISSVIMKLGNASALRVLVEKSVTNVMLDMSKTPLSAKTMRYRQETFHLMKDQIVFLVENASTIGKGSSKIYRPIPHSELKRQRR